MSARPLQSIKFALVGKFPGVDLDLLSGAIGFRGGLMVSLSDVEDGFVVLGRDPTQREMRAMDIVPCNQITVEEFISALAKGVVPPRRVLIGQHSSTSRHDPAGADVQEEDEMTITKEGLPEFSAIPASLPEFLRSHIRDSTSFVIRDAISSSPILDFESFVGADYISRVSFAHGSFKTVYLTSGDNVISVIPVMYPEVLDCVKHEYRIGQEFKSIDRVFTPLEKVALVTTNDGRRIILTISKFVGKNIFETGLNLTQFRTLVKAVKRAHAVGLVHRDLRVNNITLDSQGNVHVIDFGLAMRDESQTNNDRGRLEMSIPVIGASSSEIQHVVASLSPKVRKKTLR